MSEDKKVKCDFCGAEHTKDEWKQMGVKLFRSRTGSTDEEKLRICSSCLEKGYSKLEEANKKKSKKRTNKTETDIKTPRDIKAYLDEWVIDQEKPKIALATELYAHKKRIRRFEEDPNAAADLRMDKSNIIYLGPTGSGKTESVRAMCSCMGLPYTIEDASSLSATGYVGRDADEILKNLYINAGRDIEKAQKGIVFIDEFDKVKASTDGRGDNKDVNGKAVQQSILKMIEGTVMDVRLDKMMGKTIKFDTTNVLFILGGAFVGLEKIIDARLKKGQASIGFGGKPVVKDKINYNDTISKVQPEDLEKYGIIPEVIGRCPILTVFHELSVDAMVQILTEPKHALIKQYKEEFKMDGIEFEVDNKALVAIAKKAIARKMGARALKTVMEDILFEAKFSAPGDETVEKIIINKDLTVTIQRKEEALISE